MKAIASLVVLLCWLAAPALARAPALPATDRVRIAEAFRLADALTERLWAGWSQAPFAVLLVTPEREFLIRHPRPTSDFQSLGDDSLLMAREGDGSRPDLGLFRVWSHTRAIARLFPEVTDPSVDINRYPLTPAARAQLAEFNRATDNPTANCVPKGMPTIMEAPYPIEFVRQANGDVVLNLEEYDLKRYIYMNPSVTRELTQPTPLGDSVGRWDGTALVVTTTRISWPFFSQLGIKQSPAVQIVERFTPTPDGTRLSYTMTITDPATFTAPLELKRSWVWRPGETVKPYNCVERKAR